MLLLMHHFFVINPHSFPDIKIFGQVKEEIDSCFQNEDKNLYKIFISRYSRDAIGAIHHYISSLSSDETIRVYAVGGDGILFDCLNGMVDFPNAELTSVPYGNSNDFVRIFGSSSLLAFRNIKSLINSPSRPVDIIHCGANFSLIEVCIGVMGQSVIYSNNAFRRFPNKLTRLFMPYIYMISGLLSLSKKELIQQSYTVSIDNEDLSGKYSNIHISNGPCDGRTLIPSPYAIPDDGLLDVIFTGSSSRLRIATVIQDYLKGWFEKYKLFIYKRCRVVEVKSDDLMRVAMDGETFYAKELKISIIKGGIKFFTPPGMNFEDYSKKAYKRKK